MVLLGNTAWRGKGDTGVVEEDMEFLFFGVENLDGGFDGAEVLERQVQVMKLSRSRRGWGRKWFLLDLLDTLKGVGFGAGSNVDLATCVVEDVCLGRLFEVQ